MYLEYIGKTITKSSLITGNTNNGSDPKKLCTFRKWRDKLLSEQQKQAALSKEYKAQVKQLIEMNRITPAKGDIDFNFTDNNVIKNIVVDKLTQSQLISGRLAIARLDSVGKMEYAKTFIFKPLCDYSVHCHYYRLLSHLSTKIS